MPYRAPNSHIWFRSPSPIYSPPTPPLPKETPLPKANALLQAIDDASSTRFQTEKGTAAVSSFRASISSEAVAATSTPSKAFNHKSHGQQSISNYLVGTDRSHVRKSKAIINKSTSQKLKSSGNSKIVFDRIPADKVHDGTLPIIAGLQKQQLIAKKRKLDDEAYVRGSQEPERSKRAQTSSATSSSPSRFETCSAPSSSLSTSTRLKTEKEVSHDWLAENLDQLLPPLTEEDIIELSEEGEGAVSRDTTFSFSPSVQYCTYRSTRLPPPLHSSNKPVSKREYQSELPCSKQLSVWESLPESQSQTAVEEDCPVDRTVCDDDDVVFDIHEAGPDVCPPFRANCPFSNRLGHESLGDSFQWVQPACGASRRPASQSSTSNSSSNDPYRHPDFQTTTGEAWSTLPRSSVKRTNHLPRPTKIAVSKRFTLPANVFGQVSKLPPTSRPAVKAFVSPLPLRKGVTLFKPEPQDRAEGSLYTVHTLAGMRYGPALYGDGHHSAHPWNKTSYNSKPTVEITSTQEHSSGGLPRNLQSLSCEEVESNDWSEFACITTSSSPSSCAETLVNLEGYTNDKPTCDVVKTPLYFRLEPTTTDFTGNLSPAPSPPASPTLAFSLQEARGQYAKWRAMLESGLPRKTESLSEDVLMERLVDLVGRKYQH